MAGTQPGFDDKKFREKMRFVFDMAAPPVTDDRVTFHFEPVLVFTGPVDADQVPFDPDSTVQAQTPTPLQVTCAVEYVDADNAATPYGLMAPSKVRITLLDEEYALVKTAKFVVIAGDRYDYRRTIPPTGLFPVGLFTMVFQAMNET